MRIVTWNINSLRLRLPLLERLITALDPDVICLQETKVPDDLFPDAAPRDPRLPLRRPPRHEELQRRRHPLPP
ncbi:MAG: endonuclease/exonuclease/phosphatase family protein [Rhodospirillales bacterium]